MTFDVASVRENKNVDVSDGIRMSGQFVPDDIAGDQLADRKLDQLRVGVYLERTTEDMDESAVGMRRGV
jgi:hypothetical protein